MPEKSPRPLGGGRHGGRRGDALRVAQPLVVSEEERAVLLQRAAHRTAELVLFELLRLLREVALGVECVVADELVEAAAEAVAPRAGDDAGRGAAGAAELRRRALGEDAELGDGVHRNAQRVAAVHAVLVLRAVHEVGVLLGTLAVHGIGLPLPEAAARGGHAGRERRDAGLQQPELGEVAAVERQIHELAPRHDRAERVGGRVHQPLLAGHGDRLLNVRQRQRGVHPHRVADAHLNRLLHQPRELRRFDRQRVAAYGNQQQTVEAVGGRRGLAREARVEVAHGHLGAGQRRRRRVHDGAFDGAGGGLGERGRRERADQNGRQQQSCHHLVGPVRVEAA
jgi:hypothetical protein